MKVKIVSFLRKRGEDSCRGFCPIPLFSFGDTDLRFFTGSDICVPFEGEFLVEEVWK